MNTKKLIVSFLVIASILLISSLISATELTSVYNVRVDDISVPGNVVSVIAGELVTVEVYFTANVNDQDVTIKAELEGDKVDVESITKSFDVESNKSYKKTLTIRVPYELKDALSDNLALNIEIDGKDSKTKIPEITLRVQRPSYNANIKSVSVQGTADAGENFPVDIVLKNIGYNDLDDLYVTVSIPALGIQREGYFGDIVALEANSDDDDDTDTVSGRLLLKVPYDAKAGTYTIEVEVKNDDTTSSKTAQLNVANDFTSNVIVTNTMSTVAVGENAEYSILLVNPTDKLKVYRIVTESSGSLSSNADSAVVAVPAGSSKTVKITANADSEGEYTFKVNVFAGEQLVDAVTLNAKVEGKSTSKIGTNNPVVILTVVLAIIFIVLLIVLIVLIGKKPQKSEEFGESYY
ncbi:MAG: hypothetical protein WC584_03300 [Candidatus Pacearchaeota archaeon]